MLVTLMCYRVMSILTSRACAQAKQQKPYIESSHLFDDFISSCTIGGVGYFRIVK